jgi:hypothetical protein
MLRNRWIWCGITVVMGSLQAWDSGVLRAPAAIQALVALAIAIPAVTVVVSANYGWQALSVLAGFVLLTVARVFATVPLPTLHIIAFIPAVLIFFSHAVQPQRVTPNA